VIALAVLLSIAAAAGGNPPAPPDVSAPPADVRPTPSGLAMKVLRTGRGTDHPTDNDCGRIHFTVWKRDGALLANSREDAEPRFQCLRTAMKGVAEALRSMAPGEQRRIWLPAALTFPGEDPDEEPPQIDVTIDLELLELIKAPPMPADLEAPPASAQRTESGVAFVVLKKGEGKESPSGGRRVKLHFSGWTTKGVLFESTVFSGRPAVYGLGEVIPGWREVLPRLVAGDKARIWIPANLAYGEKPRRRGFPAGALVYELELLALE
jgi:FKBP-type peptidyl-prolyl cis-trans isomerase